MALTSALFTGLSGLDVNQTRLNVVGNNIANVNTVAFKSSRALFKPQFYVTDAAGSAPTDNFGGENPSQRGLGAVVSQIEKNFGAGSIEPTGKPTELAIEGEGFFILDNRGEQMITRDGSFSLNSTNQLVSAAGAFVQGYGVDTNGNIINGTLSKLTVPLGVLTSAKATENTSLEGNLNAAGIVASGASILLSQPLTTLNAASLPTGSTLLTDLALSSANTQSLFTAGDVLSLKGKLGGRDLPEKDFTVTATSTLADLQQYFQGGMGIDTTVPASTDPQVPTPGVSLQTVATDPTAIQINLTGNVGTENSLSISGSSFVKTNGGSLFTFADGTDSNGIVSNPSGESVHTSFVAYDSLGTPMTVDVTAVLESKADTGNTWRFYASSPDDTDKNLVLGNGTLTFNSDGTLKSVTGNSIKIDRNNTGAQTPMSIKLDFSSLTALTSSTSSLRMGGQDGSRVGTLSSFSIGADGVITGSFTNGLLRSLGQVAIATFKNNQGLVDKGSNLFVAGPNSGPAMIGEPGQNGVGMVRSGSLELSNVDLSQEFVNLIIASTGFSASSRVITASNQLLTELLNSQR